MDGELKPDELQTLMSGFAVKFSAKVLLSATYGHVGS
jgi:hypothetical protein